MRHPSESDHQLLNWDEIGEIREMAKDGSVEGYF
jgi:hypothetical protein